MRLDRPVAAVGDPVDSSGNTSNMTVSMGVSVWPDDGDSLVEALSIADLRLYQAKRTGRNRVVTTTLEQEEGGRRGDQLRRHTHGKN